MLPKTAVPPNVVKLEPNKKQASSAPCPICKKPQAAEFSPFCSRHCANLDLGRWLDGGYAIPSDETPEMSPDFDHESED